MTVCDSSLSPSTIQYMLYHPKLILVHILPDYLSIVVLRLKHVKFFSLIRDAQWIYLLLFSSARLVASPCSLSLYVCVSFCFVSLALRNISFLYAFPSTNVIFITSDVLFLHLYVQCACIR